MHSALSIRKDPSSARTPPHVQLCILLLRERALCPRWPTRVFLLYEHSSLYCTLQILRFLRIEGNMKSKFDIQKGQNKSYLIKVLLVWLFMSNDQTWQNKRVVSISMPFFFNCLLKFSSLGATSSKSILATQKVADLQFGTLPLTQYHTYRTCSKTYLLNEEM